MFEDISHVLVYKSIFNQVTSRYEHQISCNNKVLALCSQRKRCLIDIKNLISNDQQPLRETTIVFKI